MSEKNLSAEAIEARRAYLREYRKRNREKYLEWQRAYRETHREELNRYQREYRLAHREEVKEYNRRYWQRKADAVESVGGAEA